MKRFVTSITAVVFLCSGVLLLLTRAMSQSVHYICFEAEDVTSIQAPMRIAKVKRKNERVSGKAYLELPWFKKKKGQDLGRAVYKIKVKHPGVYYLWVRSYWIHGCGNSIAVVVDKQRPVVITDNTFNSWQWRQAQAQFRLTAGEHTIQIIGREPGIRVDEIYLTTDRGYVPQGIRKPNYQVNPKNKKKK